MNPLTLSRAAISKGTSLLKSKLAAINSTHLVTTKILQPAYAKIPRNVGMHPAFRRQVGGRWYSTTVKSLLRFGGNVAVPRFTYSAPVRTAIVGKLSVASPFGSTLRPMLTGGAFPRTSIGYSIGGNGARYFSHSPAAPAQVFHQVSAAMRAFVLSGEDQMKTYRRHDGKLGRIGVRAQLAASLAQQSSPGAYVDFDLSPTMSCISPFNQASCTLENPDFLRELSADLGAMMQDLIAINADIRRLSSLGDLPITMASPTTIRVHFRGCERDFVERLCDEVGVIRGIVHEDERFAFCMATTAADAVNWGEMMSNSPASSTYSEDGFDDDCSDDGHYDAIRSRITGSNSIPESVFFAPVDRPVMVGSPACSSSNGSDSYKGLQGIHKFLEECDEYKSGLSAWR